MTKKVFISTGEHSGDIHASHVIKELKKLSADIEIAGIGGSEMNKAGARLIHDHSDMAVVGIDSFKKVPQHIFLIFKILQFFKTDFTPNLILLVDYGGFHLRLAKILKFFNYKIFYYITPQVWASRRKRVNTIKKYIDKVFLIFPFEEEIYNNASIDNHFVGHPLVSQLPEATLKPDFCMEYGFDPSLPLIGICPGSRKVEIKLLLENYLETAWLISKKIPDAQFCIAQSESISDDYMTNFISQSQFYNTLNVKLIKNKTHQILSASDFLILKSGTVTLEAAIYQTPMIISYKSYRIPYYIYLYLRDIKVFGLPNIVTGKTIVPEFLQKNLIPEQMAKTAINLIDDTPERKTMLENLAEVNKALTKNVASAKVAEIIFNEL